MEQQEKINEKKYLLSKYLNHEETLDHLIWLRSKISDIIINESCLYGSAMYDDPENVYSRAVPVETLALEIVAKSRAIDKRIEKIKKRSDQFKEHFTPKQIESLKMAQNKPILSGLEAKAYKYIDELEKHERTQAHERNKIKIYKGTYNPTKNKGAEYGTL